MAKRYKYLYVNKNPLFLPFAWIHRIAYGLIRKDFAYQEKKAILVIKHLIVLPMIEIVF